MLLRLVVSSSGGVTTTCSVHRHYCLVKVFKVSQLSIRIIHATLIVMYVRIKVLTESTSKIFRNERSYHPMKLLVVVTCIQLLFVCFQDRYWKSKPYTLFEPVSTCMYTQHHYHTAPLSQHHHHSITAQLISVYMYDTGLILFPATTQFTSYANV